MGTVLCFHAHPDDESMATACLLAKAHAAGHRTVLVFATRGEWGEIVPGVLADGEQLALRRTAETYASAEALGVDRVEFLGYVDSDMMGRPPNDAPWSFWQADVDHAARRLATILDEEDPDVVTCYDENGNYGHPDHIQVHRVAHRAAQLVGLPVVWEGTMNRDHLRRLMEAREQLLEDGAGEMPEPSSEPPPIDTLGLPESALTHKLDGSDVWRKKMESMRAHRSQIADDHFTLAMPEEAFTMAFGTEWYRAQRSGGGPVEDPAPGGSVAAELFTPIA